MIPPKIIRKKILETLRMAQGYGKTEAMVRELTGALAGEEIPLQHLRDAMEPLHQDALIRSEEDDDGAVLWYITPRGIAKLNTL